MTSTRRRFSPFLWSAAGSAAPMLATFAVTPMLVHRLGAQGFGLWVLLQTVVTIVVQTDFGLSGAVTRFLAVHRGSQDSAAATRLLVTASAAVALAGAALAVGILLAGPAIVRHTAHGPLASAARTAVAPLAVLVVSAVLQGLGVAVTAAHHRFRLLAGVTLSVAVGYLLLVATTVHHLNDFDRLVWLAAGQAAVSALILLACAAPSLRTDAVGLMQREEREEFRRYAWRVQLASAAALVNTELDAIIIAWLLPIRLVGAYGIGAAVASAVRSLPLFMLPPVRTQMAFTFGAAGGDALLAEFARRHRQWLSLVLRYSLVTCVSAPFCILAWVGRDFRTAAVTSTVLIAGFAVNLMTAVAAIYVQSVGRTDLESRYGWVAVVVNLVLTVPLGLAFGLYGVVTATAVGAASSSVYFLWLTAKLPGVQGRQLLPAASVANAVPVALAVAVLQVGLDAWTGLSRGLWLVLALASAGAGLAVMVVVDRETRFWIGGSAALSGDRLSGSTVEPS